jgi:hypothetical protein
MKRKNIGILIEFTISKNDILGKRIKRSPVLQETSIAALMASEESAAAEHVYERPLLGAYTQPRPGIWLNGGYYVSTPRTSGTKVEYDMREAGFREATNIVMEPKINQRMVFKLQGKINGGGTTPSMQLMPRKPTKGPRQ